MYHLRPPYITVPLNGNQKACRRADSKNEKMFQEWLRRCQQASELLNGMVVLQFEVEPPPTKSNTSRRTQEKYQAARTCSVHVSHSPMQHTDLHSPANVSHDNAITPRGVQSAQRPVSPIYGFPQQSHWQNAPFTPVQNQMIVSDVFTPVQTHLTIPGSSQSLHHPVAVAPPYHP